MKKIIVLMAAIVMMSGNAMAQRQRNGGGNFNPEQMAQRRAEMIQRQAEQLAKDMNLKKDAKTEFIADYTAYQGELNSAGGMDMNNMAAMFGGMGGDQKKVKDMSEDECLEEVTKAITRLDQQAQQAQKRLEVTKKWVAAFMAKEYTPQQLYQIFAQTPRMGGNAAGGRGMGGFGGGMPGGFGGGMPGGGMPGGMGF